MYNNINILGYTAALLTTTESALSTINVAIFDDFKLQNFDIMKQAVGNWAIARMKAGSKISATFSKSFDPIGLTDPKLVPARWTHSLHGVQHTRTVSIHRLVLQAKVYLVQQYTEAGLVIRVPHLPILMLLMSLPL